MKPVPFFRSKNRDFTLLQGDCVSLLKQFDFKFDMIFADPPYFLSNGGISVQSGKVVTVDKGDWDKSAGFVRDNQFNYDWLQAVRDKLSDSGTIWISGTLHNTFSVAQMLTELNYKILNVITWVKTNPPPNISCRCFTHSTEIIIWARKCRKVPHHFNYELMRELNGGKQMRDVWELPAIAPWEKKYGKHPTQKPLRLLSRIIQASTKQGDWILDPFAGSCTTGIASSLLRRRFLGIDREKEFIELGKKRREDLDDLNICVDYMSRIPEMKDLKSFVAEGLLVYEVSDLPDFSTLLLNP